MAPKLDAVPSKEMWLWLRVTPETDADALCKALVAIPGVQFAAVKEKTK